MGVSLGTLAGLFGWRVARDAVVESFGFVESPVPDRLVFANDARFLRRAAADPSIAGVLTTAALSGAALATGIPGVATADEPQRAFFLAHNHLVAAGTLYGAPPATEIDATATVHPRAHVDDRGVRIGPGCRIDAGATIIDGTILDADVHVLSGATLGSTGFQVLRLPDTVIDLRHVGRLEIGARTVVMANAVLARAVFATATRIGPDCRIGNGAIVSHGCVVGSGVTIGHGAILNGNSTVGAGAGIGPGAVCVDRLTIGARAVVTAGSVVVRDVAPGERVSGNFAVGHRRHLRRSVDTD